MARAPRAIVPGVPVHLIQRGNNRTATFQSADDFQRFRETLYESSLKFGCAIHAYVLMTNHAHLLITPNDTGGLSRMMQAIGRRYVRYVNARYQRTGTLWEGRFKSSLVDEERYLLTCSRYIELNPVRARMVDEPAQYHWSSHRHNAHGEPDALITPHHVYDTLGTNPVDRQTAYRALFQSPLDAPTLDTIRHATDDGCLLGGSEFAERIEATLQRRVSRLPHGGDRRSDEFHAGKQPPDRRIVFQQL